MATKKGLEPSTSSVTGWRSNQLNYLAMCAFVLELKLAYYSKYRAECQHHFLFFLQFFQRAAGNRRPLLYLQLPGLEPLYGQRPAADEYRQCNDDDRQNRKYGQHPSY